MATQKDVAKLADVSFITVSRVINDMGNVKDDTRLRVLEAIKELNYYPNSIAQRLNKNKINTIAVQSPIPVNVGIEETSYYRRLLIGIEKFCIEQNYDILLSTQRAGNDVFDYLKPFYERKADGILILGARPTNDEYDRIVNEKIPCVVIGDRHPDVNGFYVDTDNFKGMYDATSYVLKNNHKKIAYLLGNNINHNAKDRFEGFKSAMEEYKISLNEQFIYHGDYTKESGRSALKHFLSLNDKPTAIISSTDLMAIGVYEEAVHTGLKIPDDISIFGFDGHEICQYTNPPLATMHQPLEQMGEEAARLLINQIENENCSPQHIIFPVKLNQGKSIADLKLV